MGVLVLVRHGETEWSATGRHTGVTDVPLTSVGERQARAVGDCLAGVSFVRVLSSPLQRARRTAALAGLGTVEIDDDLVEWDYGGYEGRTTAEISLELGRPWTLFSDGVVAGATPGESLDAVAARCRAVLDRVRPSLAAGAVALVGHGHNLRVLAACWLDLPPAAAAHLQLAAGTVSVLGSEHEVATVALWNERPAAPLAAAYLR